MKATMSVIVAFIFTFITTINISFCDGSSHVGCIESERQALLRFKKDLVDPSKRLASWSTGDRDCCTWSSVVCDNLTGYVFELNLRSTIEPLWNEDETFAEISAEDEAWENSKLSGKINHSLLELKHLRSLDLSNNNFEGTQIPRFLGSMESLRSLNLSFNGFSGMIPHQLGNLSNLQHLSLDGYSWLDVDNLWWLSNLSLLEHLDLRANLRKSSDSLQVISTLPSLKVLKLSRCELHSFPQLHIANFSSLVTLRHVDLSGNEFEGPIPDGLQNLTSLKHLDLSANHFNSSLPDWFCRLNCLEELFLQENSLQGSIGVLGNLTSMKALDLSFNGFEGGIPIGMGKLCNLRSFSVSHVKLNQDVSEVLNIFAKCVSKKLEYLDLKGSQLFGQLTSQLGQFKNLGSLFLGYNSISGPIPSSLGQLSNLCELYLDHNSISGPVPSCLGQLSSLEVLYVSYNKLNGTLSEIHFANLIRLSEFRASENSLMFNVSCQWIPPFKLTVLDLSSCYLGPRFPSWLLSQSHLRSLDISNSSIVDTIPTNLLKFPFQFVRLNLSHNQLYGRIPDLTESTQLYTLDLNSNNLSGRLPLIPNNVFLIDLSHNSLSGSIFHSLCYKMNKSNTLVLLNLGQNLLSGELPDCWMNWQNLANLKLDNNRFTGNLPSSIGTLNSLQSLHLRTNGLFGTIHVLLKNLTGLVTLDIGENEFVGNIPTRIGESLPEIQILNLHSNKFDGLLPTEICRLASLRILDLAYNNFSGTIPRCINNFSAMSMTTYSGESGLMQLGWSSPGEAGVFFNQIEESSIVNKGNMAKYNTILGLVRIIDLSKNSFSGEIPTEVTNLEMLQSLNLSHNFLTGKIPENIGAMRSLETLDLSRNQLFGEIPPSLSGLTFLSRLDLSNNSLTGKIPLSTQLRGFDASCFSGNELCGPPLPNNCTVTDSTPGNNNGRPKDGNQHEVDWFYVGMALGSVVGFWCGIGPLLLSRKWRDMYYHFLNRLLEKLGSVVRKVINH